MPNKEAYKIPANPIVDIHTHMYPPPYVDLLKKRKEVPYIRNFKDDPKNSRLIILPGEDSPSTPSTSRGRPVGPAYWSVEEKIRFMDQHKIDVSVISLANPWLDFITDEAEAVSMAQKINDWFNELGERYGGRIFAFGVLPIGASVEAVQAEIHRIKTLKWLRGVVLGTSGRGKGLDDPEFVPIWQTVAETEQMVFLHPHYGLPTELYGPQNDRYGHVLPLALGFPLETTIAITRMILSGIFSQLPNLKVLLAHAGGTLPYLAGRIQSCIFHDAHFAKAGSKINVVEILNRNIFLDAVIYDKSSLGTAVELATPNRVIFGTDHPFFPPLNPEDETWNSVLYNWHAVGDATTWTDDWSKIMGQNAVNILDLDFKES